MTCSVLLAFRSARQLKSQRRKHSGLMGFVLHSLMYQTAKDIIEAFGDKLMLATIETPIGWITDMDDLGGPLRQV